MPGRRLDAARGADLVLEVLQLPVEIDELSVTVPASIGIAMAEQGHAHTNLMRDADIALYEAKAAGRNRYVAFQREMQTAVEDRLTLELDLRNAIERNQYFLVYQPIFDLETGTVLTGLGPRRRR